MDCLFFQSPRETNETYASSAAMPDCIPHSLGEFALIKLIKI